MCSVTDIVSLDGVV